MCESNAKKIDVYLIDVLRSEPVLSQQLIRGQVEHVQGVRTNLYSRFVDPYCPSIQHPQSITCIHVNPRKKYLTNL